jgi:predicted Zn-dependent protease
MKKRTLEKLCSEFILKTFPLIADLEQRVARLETLDDQLARDVLQLKDNPIHPRSGGIRRFDQEGR